MSKIKIWCDEVFIDTKHNDNQVLVALENYDIEFISDLPIEDILKGSNTAELFDKLIKNDEDILHNYLEQNGYIFTKA